MATIYSGAQDGYINYIDGTWATARDATAGENAYPDVHNNAAPLRAYLHRGSYNLSRCFFIFDTSGITSTVASVTLKIYGAYAGAADFFVVKSSQGATLEIADYDAIDGWNNSGVDNEGNVTKYSSEITSWSTSGYNDITLNSTALSDMVSLDSFTVCLIESVHDLRNVAPTANTFKNGMYFQNQDGTSYDPYIDYTLAVTGYGNSVMGIASGDIANINGIATADISKVNGV